MCCIGKEIIEELECIFVKLYIKCYIRYKYVFKNGEGKYLIVFLFEWVINKGILGVGLLVGILEDKYVYYLLFDW